ncbi:Crp/FNR family transcriptional regulator [Cupriavidus sp. H18C1]
MMVMLADMSAEQRLASFLLNFASRMQSHGYSGTDLRLRMTRAEIGSYLGMTLETVSRTFSRLQQDRLISVKGKQVTLTDKDRLDRL